MSLSMVLGTATTPIFTARRWISAVSCIAPRMVPSPPTTNRTSMPSASRLSTTSPASCEPRDEPKMVPPWWWMWATDSGVMAIGWCPKREISPS
jgi:hypothetical protein